MPAEAPEPGTVAPDPLVGRVIGDRYRIVERIGQGGMGRVYKALQAPLDRVVALKVLGEGHERDAHVDQRFLLEASVTARLTHPNSVTVHDFGRSADDIFFIAMEYLDGRTLSAAIQQEGALAQERVIHIAQQICRSLREAHALGILHRDLKPANVMLLVQHDDHDFVKVLDFGLVKVFSDDAADGDLSNAGTVMGSPHYIAPEQARNQSPDQRCDIYSLGVVMYQMLTGHLPFTAPTPVDVILKHVHEAPVMPRLARPDLGIDAGLEAVVLRCMAKAREDRFQSMDEILSALKQVRARIVALGMPSSAPPPLPVDVFEEDAPREPPDADRRRRAVRLAIAASAAMAAMAAAGLIVHALSAPIADTNAAMAANTSTAAAVATPPGAARAGAITVTSEPAGLEVRDRRGRLLGTTPLQLPAPPGSPLQITIVNRRAPPGSPTARMQASAAPSP